MNRLLLDQGLSPQAAAILRTLGFDAVHTSEIGMSRADDIEILDRARDDGRICVTLDHDFHAHLATSKQGRPSVIFLRAQSLDAYHQSDLIQTICGRCSDALEKGAAVSADLESIRIRRLPLR